MYELHSQASSENKQNKVGKVKSAEFHADEESYRNLGLKIIRNEVIDL